MLQSTYYSYLNFTSQSNLFVIIKQHKIDFQFTKITSFLCKIQGIIHYCITIVNNLFNHLSIYLLVVFSYSLLFHFHFIIIDLYKLTRQIFVKIYNYLEIIKYINIPEKTNTDIYLLYQLKTNIQRSKNITLA